MQSESGTEDDFSLDETHGSWLMAHESGVVDEMTV